MTITAPCTKAAPMDGTAVATGAATPPARLPSDVSRRLTGESAPGAHDRSQRPRRHSVLIDPEATPGRHHLPIGELVTEGGERLENVTIAYECWGRLNPTRTNAVLVEHALTGDAHVVGAEGPGQPTDGWWDGVIGSGAPIDSDQYFVIATNVLGGCMGSTGPASIAADGRPYGSRFPRLTIRDMVAAEMVVARLFGIEKFAAVIGGSMGGMRALEWAVIAPDQVRRAIILASTAAATADQIAWSAMQLEAIRLDPHFAGGDYYGGPIPRGGLALARQIAHAMYRSGTEFAARFGRAAQSGEDPAQGGRYAVESYLQHHGDKLGRRFDPNSYAVLTDAMNSHDVGRGRGGEVAALRRVIADTTVASVDTDRLYLPEEGARIAAGVARPRPLKIIHSVFGHDGFLIESDQVGKLIRTALGT